MIINIENLIIKLCNKIKPNNWYLINNLQKRFSTNSVNLSLNITSKSQSKFLGNTKISNQLSINNKKPNRLFCTEMSKPHKNKRKHNDQDRHPSHLRGKEIGLFYARRNKQQTTQNLNEGINLGTLNLTDNKMRQIEKMLETSSPTNLFKIDNRTYDHISDSMFKRDFLRILNESIDDKLRKTPTTILCDSEIDKKLYEQYLIKKETNHKYTQMLAKRRKLPSYSMKNQILDMIDSNQVVVISGETGCGKTTQVAQFILDDFIENRRGSLCSIICTQPRRISAISVAERVAEERAEALGQSVGYQIRLEKKLPKNHGSICFCTTGIVLKLMEEDPALSKVSHLILDEIHERDVLSDFLLTLIKKIIKKRTDLKVILMSATLNSEKFSKYYDNSPHLNIPGFTYPVKEYYLEDVLLKTRFEFEEDNQRRNERKRHGKPNFSDLEFKSFIQPHIRFLESRGNYPRFVLKQLQNPKSEEINLDLILSLLKHICREEPDQGAILIFLTGFSEISKLNQLIEQSGNFPRHKYRVFPLHSLLPTVDQKQIFEPPPNGVRKIIISTNIAETSITIDDVVYVIDCGKIKTSNFDIKSNSETLLPEWVSLANASQRKGRAGRVKPGICYHLFSTARKLMLEQFQEPEILRKRLEDVILTAKVLQLGKIQPFFQLLIDCPDPQATLLALDLLKQLNALDDDENLTPLGYHLAKLPMAPQMGKMILFGAIFSCLDPILSIAASLDFKDAFQLPLGKEDEVTRKKLDLANGVKSDHLLFYEALKQYENYSGNSRYFCWEYFLSSHTLKLLQDMKKQFMGYLFEMNFVPNSDPKCIDCNRNSDNISLIKAIICAGLYPNVLISKKRGRPPVYTTDLKKLSIHPKSVLAKESYFETPLMVYYRKLKSTSDFVHDATMVHPLPIIFFGDKFVHERNDTGALNTIRINQRMKFKCTEKSALVIQEVRNRFNWFLEYKISHPGPINWSDKKSETKVLEVVLELITWEHLGDLDFEENGDYD